MILIHIMNCKVICGLLWIFSVLLICDSIGISGKLDFGDDHPAIFSSRDNVQKFPGISGNYKTVKTFEKSGGDDLDNIGVVCVSGGCNTTKSSSKAGVETDVVVHVKTRVDLNKANVDDTPDVPVVLGYSGTDGDEGGSLNVQPLEITNLEDELTNKVYSTSTYRPFTTSTTTYSPFDNRRSFVPNSNPFSTYSPLHGYPSGYSGNGYTTNGYSTNGYSTNGYTTKGYSPSFYGISTESPLPSYNPSFSYGLNNEPRVDITLKSLPEDLHRNLIKEGQFNIGNQYNTRTRTYSTPTYRTIHKPSLNRHRYQNTWDSQDGTVFHRHTANGLETCTCKKQQPDIQRNNEWYPDNQNRRVSLDDPGSQINDKLAPLN